MPLNSQHEMALAAMAIRNAAAEAEIVTFFTDTLEGVS
jgi:hypothetical protein